MSFWVNKRVLITGDKGFVGSNLSFVLKQAGAIVHGLDIKCLSEDIFSYRTVDECVRENNIEMVYHLAAEAIVGNSQKEPIRAFMSNICGTWNVLEVCRLNKNVKAVIVASSDKAYGEHSKLPYKEEYLLKANYPYDVSKSCADMLAQSYHKSYGLPVVITRCGNIYGHGDDHRCRLVPRAISCLLSGDTLEVRGNGKFIRDFVYINDIVSAYVKIGELFIKRSLAGNIFNLGNDKPVSILKVVKLIGCKYKLIDSSFGEINKQYLDSSKSRRVLGWKPKYTLKEGIRRTIDAYR